MAKRQKSKSSTRNRYTAREVLDLIRAANKPVAWRELADLAGADTPKLITQLRQMLKGLQRNDELERNEDGAYQVPGNLPVETAIIERRGRKLIAAGALIEDAQRLDLREGDAVEVSVVNDTARVSRFISHADTPVTGILRRDGRYAYVEGLGSYRGRVSLLERPKVGEDGDTVRVRIVDRDQRGLVGNVVDVVDSDSVLDQAITTAISSASIPDVWPEPVLAAVTKLPKSVAPGRFPHRTDLTGMPLVTIDGITAKDFDDAVFAEPAKGRRGGFRLVVAIADVGHYVKRGSAIDMEAQVRGTSVYFPDRVVPMLPEELSNGLCSLRPETPRLALTCDMRITAAGQVHSAEFVEAVIYSHARLTYEEVQGFLDNDDELPIKPANTQAVHQSLQTLAQLFEVMNTARQKRGALDFATREANIVVEEGRVTALQPVQRLLAHQLIEEAMIAANVAAASFLEAKNGLALYRVHEPPDVDKLEELRQALAHIGVRLAQGEVTPAILQTALTKLPAGADEWLYSQLALRTLQQARYTPSNQGHFGLALERYMHFTSPIRRYPDLVVHRAIKAEIARQQGRADKPVPGMDELVTLGEQCSNYERRAEGAGWLVDAWLKCDFLLDRIGDTLPGVIGGVTEFGLFVELDDYFVQGLLHISNLGKDYYHFEARSQALVGERSGQRFGLGDRVQVLIRDIEPPQGKIDLLLSNAADRSPQEGSKRGKRNTKGDSAPGSKNRKAVKDKTKQTNKSSSKNKPKHRDKAKPKSKSKRRGKR